MVFPKMPERILFDDLANENLERHKCGHKKTYDCLIAPTTHLLKTFGGKRMVEVCPDDFWTYHVPKFRKLTPNRSLNHDKKIFVQILFIAYRRGLIKVPPIKIPWPDHKKDVGRELSDTEIESLFKAAMREDIKLQMRIALLAGMRLGEIMKLEWKWIDLIRGIISLPSVATKTRRGREFPIAETLREDLCALRKLNRTNFVFPNRFNKSKPTLENKWIWNITRAVAKVKCRFHDLRHTAATRKIRAGIPMAIVAQEMGMSESVLKRIYLHLNVEDLRKSANAVQLPRVA